MGILDSYYSIGDSLGSIAKQVIAATYGKCESKNILKSKTTLLDKKGHTSLLRILDDETINADQNYLTLDFKDAFYKKFTIEIVYGDEENTKKGFRFTRSKRYEPDGKFSTVLYDHDALIKEINIHVPDKLIGNAVTVKICKPPSVLSNNKSLLDI